MSVTRRGLASWSLETLTGEPVEAFSVYCDEIINHPFTTRKKYAESVSRFLDYLFEAGIFDAGGSSPRRINEVIQAFPQLLRDGSEGLTKRIELRGCEAGDEWLLRVADALSWKRQRSVANTIAPVNRFLELSTVLAREELERARHMGIKHEDQPESLLKSLDRPIPASRMEIYRMRQNSLLGSVAKYVPKGMKRARALSLPGENMTAKKEKDFPLAHIQAVVDAAKSWRDKAFWLLLAASGIRSSEAKNLLLQDVDFDKQLVFIIDPASRHFSLPINIAEEPRFKGREMASTFLFSPLRQQFFYALGQYLTEEYVATHRPGEPQFLFQYSEPSRLGQPMIRMSDTALNKPFKAAIASANIPLKGDGTSWTLHSLRHMYGVYMLNDYPVAPKYGHFGISLVYVQMLLGHANIRSTQKYARPKAQRLMQSLQASDEALLNFGSDNIHLKNLDPRILLEVLT